MSYRSDHDAGQFLAESLARELAESRAKLAETEQQLANEIAVRPLKTNVALEATAIVGFIFGVCGVIAMLVDLAPHILDPSR